MIDILDIIPGNSYACKFKVVTLMDTLDRPAPNLSDTPVKGPAVYESIGILKQRDIENRMVLLVDEKSNREFAVSFDDIWDIDTIEWTEE